MIATLDWLARSLLRARAAHAEVDDLVTERGLAIVRAFLALAALVAVSFDPTEPARYASVAYAVLGGFATYSVALLVLLQIAKRMRPGAARLVHLVDVVAAAALTLFTEGSSSPFFIFFMFALLAAACRWTLRETTATALAAFLLLAAESLAMTRGAPATLIEGQFELNRFVMRSAWLLLVGVGVGYVADKEKLQRLRSSVVARMLSRTRTQRSLFSTLVVGADELFRLLGGRRVRLVAYDINAKRLFEWNAEPRSSEGALPVVTLREIDASEHPGYFFATPADAWLLRRRAGDPSRPELDLVWLREGAVTRTPFTVPPGLPGSMEFRSLATITVRIGGDWRFRMFIADPNPARSRVLLDILDVLGKRVAPAVYNAFQVGRLRSQAGAVERARVARDLHDGVIQSLIAAEMNLDVTRRQAVECGDQTAGALPAIQQLLRREIVNLRELAQQLNQVDLSPLPLVEQLARVVERFDRETGIAAQFTSKVDKMDLSPRACRELTRIVQEALTNVRRHSGARQALVHVADENGCFRVTIDDDGRGLPFAGRREHQELEPGSHGPRVIKERVRSIGGELVLESRPGHGTRLEVVVPRSRVSSHA